MTMIQCNKDLFALNKDGSIQSWQVFTEGSKVIVLFGKVGGKIQRKETFCKPKNVGRANETTSDEQALAEAQSKWEKQVRLGYRESIEDLKTGEVLSPMLAQDASKKPHLIEYPCHVSAKLDGLRCLVTFDADGEPVFNSRGNKTYPIQGKIVDQIKKLREESGFDMFDGEVYLHGLSLQKIVSLAKKWRSKEDIDAEIDKEYLAEFKKWQKSPEAYVKPEPNVNKYSGYTSDDLEFHIFDIPSKGKVWDSDNGYKGVWYYSDHPCRYADLMDSDRMVYKLNLGKIKIVHGSLMENEDQVKDTIGICMQRGYEGAIIRNFKGLYEFGQRSNDLLKWKIFQDTEAKVVDVEIDKNGEGVLHCVLQNGVKFKCKMKGTHAERLYDQQLKLVGEFINVTYQTLTEDGVPQFPVAKSVRDVNPETWEVNE